VVKTIYPPGHFYSPLVDNDEVKKMEGRVWPDSPEVMGIDFHDENHRRLLAEEFPVFAPGYRYPKARTDCSSPHDFYVQNSQYGGLDALTLFCMLRSLKPKTLMEIGSGFSTLLSADVNRRFFNGAMSVVCIEPYPLDFLRTGVPGVARLMQSKVEDVPIETFSALDKGDVLFIDTSHVSKTGSDVNHIYFEILPRLKAGVIVHIHDIFLPEDYPKSWVIDDGRGWNEQYVVRALLMYSSVFEVVFGCYNAYIKYPSLIKPLFNGALFGGGSLWIKKNA
jgi:Methyltransferase domain